MGLFHVIQHGQDRVFGTAVLFSQLHGSIDPFFADADGQGSDIRSRVGPVGEQLSLTAFRICIVHDFGKMGGQFIQAFHIVLIAPYVILDRRTRGNRVPGAFLAKHIQAGLYGA